MSSPQQLYHQQTEGDPLDAHLADNHIDEDVYIVPELRAPSGMEKGKI